MHPADLIVLGLIVQGGVLGHGALRLLLMPVRHRALLSLPLIAVVGYYVFVFLVPPLTLTRTYPLTTLMWLNAWRYVVQVLSFSLVVEGLILFVNRYGAQVGTLTAALQLSKTREGK